MELEGRRSRPGIWLEALRLGKLEHTRRVHRRVQRCSARLRIRGEVVRHVRGSLVLLVRHCLSHGRVVVGRLRWMHLLVAALILLLRIALPSVLAAVPPVLDCVVAASFKSSRNLSPPLTHLGYQLLNQFSLFRSDGLMIKRRLEVLVIPFPALLRGTRADFLGDADPVVRPVTANQVNEPAVFVLRPRAAAVSNHAVERKLLIRMLVFKIRDELDSTTRRHRTSRY